MLDIKDQIWLMQCDHVWIEDIFEMMFKKVKDDGGRWLCHFDVRKL